MEASRGWSAEVKNRVIAVLPHDMQHYSYATQPSASAEEETRQSEIEKTSLNKESDITESSSAVGTADDSPQTLDVYSFDETTDYEMLDSKAPGLAFEHETDAEAESQKVSDDPSSFGTDGPIETETDTSTSTPAEPTDGVSHSASR